MIAKMPTLQTFMTRVDEAAFSDLLRAHIPHVKFIDSYIWNSRVPPVHHSMSECSGQLFSDVVILDEAICTVERYTREFVAPHPSGSGYIGSMEGPGAIQFLRSREAKYAPGSLRDGRLAASYDPKFDETTDRFVKTVWKIFKKFSMKTFLIDRETGAVRDKPETRFFAGPDAAVMFDGSKGNYLTNNTLAYFVAKSSK
ncbi:hypothetical protein BLA13014_00734 [Burkholderia aenigmatica]|uniref:Uncharacterized protein n=2 Tax=Burkholderia aenigmatica TaxID=2015348 RepID=A0A6P2HU65_9BURK|nr:MULTISPECIES: hypothetical protein [unclassified Burkholderia]VWB21745.1 hypothetical protein BLA13014_00734 [Burkholderia aenigmatica]MDN7514761.1 hypothetical protein [Burkholderia sp. AU45251]HDR9483819.1 hypothetical protein [Burkholderia aenigmatica]HDR9515365.1 hypothetical protein [Burkholderia aenigmatica]HDR9592450.1 hypothetical protein [Burkholderia aenigmatica]